MEASQDEGGLHGGLPSGQDARAPQADDRLVRLVVGEAELGLPAPPMRGRSSTPDRRGQAQQQALAGPGEEVMPIRASSSSSDSMVRARTPAAMAASSSASVLPGPVKTMRVGIDAGPQDGPQLARGGDVRAEAERSDDPQDAWRGVGLDGEGEAGPAEAAPPAAARPAGG